MPYGSVDGRVLIVDDEKDICRLYKYALEKAGIGAHWVLSARDAEEAMGHGDFALALIDVELDGDDGVALADRLCISHPTLAVILMSGKDMTKLDLKSPYPVVEKPAHMHAVVERVMVQLALRWTRTTLMALDERIATWTVANMISEFLSSTKGKVLCAFAGMLCTYAVAKSEKFSGRLEALETKMIESVTILKRIDPTTRGR